MEQQHGLTAEMYRAVVALVDDRIAETRVTRQEYDRPVQSQDRVVGRMDRVEVILEQLAQAQAATGAQMKELAQAQVRTEARVGGLEAALEQLAQAQAHVVVLGEARARIGGGVVSDFSKVLKRVEPLVDGEVWRVMFGYYIHPSAKPVAEQNHIVLVASYQR